MDTHNIRMQQITDRYIGASYGLWNALLTINGIILAATIFTTSESTYVKTSILWLALFSIGMLTHNYVIMKITYFRIGEVLSVDPDLLTQEKKNKDIEVSLSRNKRVRLFENICLFILISQAVLVIIGHYTK